MTVTTLASTTDSRASAVLNRLILACNDGAEAHTAAALVVNGVQSKAELTDGATRRNTFVKELSEEVRLLGGTPDAGGTSFESFRVAMHNMRAMVVGENRGDSFSTCARIEGHSEKLYQKAMTSRLPERAQRLVTEQHTHIAADHEQLRRRSMGG